MTTIPAPQGIHEQTATVDFGTPIDIAEVATVFYAYDERDESWEGAGFFAHLDDALWSTARTFANEVYGADVTPPVPITWRIHHRLWHLWDGDSPTDIVVSDSPLLGSAPVLPPTPPTEAEQDEQLQDKLSVGDAASEDDRAPLARLPLPDRIDLVTQHLAPAAEELRGLHGASHARLLIAAAVASLRWVVDDLRSEKRPDEQPQDERDGDTRAVARAIDLIEALWSGTAGHAEAEDVLGELETRYGPRIAELKARGAKASER